MPWRSPCISSFIFQQSTSTNLDTLKLGQTPKEGRSCWASRQECRRLTQHRLVRNSYLSWMSSLTKIGDFQRNSYWTCNQYASWLLTYHELSREKPTQSLSNRCCLDHFFRLRCFLTWDHYGCSPRNGDLSSVGTKQI